MLSFQSPALLMELGHCIHLFLTLLSLCCCPGFSSVVASSGCSPVVVKGLLTAVVSPPAERGRWGTRASADVAYGLRICSSRLQRAGSKAVVKGLSRFAGPHVGSSGIRDRTPCLLCLLHWQVYSLPRSHQGFEEQVF